MMIESKLCFDCPLFNIHTLTHGNYLPLKTIQSKCDNFKICKSSLLKTEGVNKYRLSTMTITIENEN